jgi:hypothetical protein
MLRQDIHAYNGRLLGVVPNIVVASVEGFDGVIIVGLVCEEIGDRPTGL